MAKQFRKSKEIIDNLIFSASWNGNNGIRYEYSEQLKKSMSTMMKNKVETRKEKYQSLEIRFEVEKIYWI